MHLMQSLKRRGEISADRVGLIYCGDLKAAMRALCKVATDAPMKTPEIVVSIWSGTRGFLDKIAQKEILRFEALWLDFIRTSKPEILTGIAEIKQGTTLERSMSVSWLQRPREVHKDP